MIILIKAICQRCPAKEFCRELCSVHTYTSLIILGEKLHDDMKNAYDFQMNPIITRQDLQEITSKINVNRHKLYAAFARN